MPSRPTPHRLPWPSSALFRRLLPCAERDEVLVDLAAEYRARRRRHGAVRARVWLCRQLLGSIPALMRRGWWRGMTGFEPQANRLRPGGPMFESWIMDARYAVRRLMSRPVFTLLAVLTLALGAGGTAAIFSVVRGLLLDRLPIVDEEEVGVFWMDGSWNETEFLHLRPEFPGFSIVGGYRPQDATLDLPGQPLRMANGVVATAELFDVLGTPAMIGRTFRPGDDLPGAEPSAVISHSLWEELGADSTLVGRQLILGGAPRTIVGVMPPGFWFPRPRTEVWMAASLNPQRSVGEYSLIGRVADGQRLESLSGPLATLVGRLTERFRYPVGQWDKTTNPAVTPVREFLIGDVRPGLVATFVAMALILLIACVNVATLMLGQVSARASELAVRAAIGAARARLIQQLTIEAVILGLISGVVGALLAVAGFRVLLRSLPLGELAATVTVDWTLFWAAMVAAGVAATVVGLIAATAMLRGNLQGTLATTRTGGISVRGGRLEGALVVGQIALAVLLATGAGLLIRSAANLRGIDAGVDLDTIGVVDVTAPVQLNANGRREAYLNALRALQEVPGVHAAAATQRLPLRGSSDNWGIRVPGRPEFDNTSTYMRVITPQYFRTMGIEVRQGRGFVPTDADSARRVVVINEAMAAKYFPGQNPLGRIVDTGFDERGEEVIGVVENVAEGELTSAAEPARYMLYPHVGNGVLPAVTYVVRANSPAELPAMLQAARGAIQRAAPQLAVNNTTTMAAEFDRAVGPTGQVVTLVSLLAGLALLLGAVGVYGVMSHFVSRRMRDYSICMMLGLPPARVLAQVVRRGTTMVVAGGVIGAGIAVALTRLLGSLLYNVSATDPIAILAAVVALLVVGALAAFIPARRASLTDPVVVLRQQ
jgi:putative ABC transport system permease protein